MRAVCDFCDNEMSVEQSDFQILKEGEYEVTYFSCPKCGAKFQVITTDEEFRELIKKRIACHRKLELARLKRFTEKTFRSYIREFKKVKSEQEKRIHGLKKIGDDILKKKFSKIGSNFEKEEEGT